MLADHQNVVRQAIRCYLELEPDFAVVGETADGLEVVPLVERLRPHALLLDIALPGLYAPEIARQVRRRAPRTAIIVVSSHVNERQVTEALRSGALGYVVKQADAVELVTAIRTATSGRRYLSRPLSEEVVEAWLQRPPSGTDPYERLTTRERQVLQLVAEGYSSRGIATRLSISARTAEAHRANVMQKLRLRNQGDLIRYALRRGMLSLSESLPVEGRGRRPSRN